MKTALNVAAMFLVCLVVILFFVDGAADVIATRPYWRM